MIKNKILKKNVPMLELQSLVAAWHFLASLGKQVTQLQCENSSSSFLRVLPKI